MVGAILLFVGFWILAGILICISERVYRRSHENINNSNNNISGMQSDTREKKSMTKEEINQLPCLEYIVREREIKRVVCLLENFKVGDICRLLPNCKHNFHVQCIVTWSSTTSVCPICRNGAGVLNVEREGTSLSETGVELV